MRMRFRPKKVLINPTWEQTLECYPLMAFSHYLTGRVEVLHAFADEIVESLDKAFSRKCVHYCFLVRAESLMWLWTLGAYEVVRTMCQAKGCFLRGRWRGSLSSRKLCLPFVCPLLRWRNLGGRLLYPPIGVPQDWMFPTEICS